MKTDSKEGNKEEKKLTPHTLRLLRLITTSSSTTRSSSESTRQAISLLTKIASRSHPVILWDILARLYASLTAPDESDAVGGGVVRRDNVALAMEHVAKYIPVSDQRSFLMDDHEDCNENENETDNNEDDQQSERGDTERRKSRQWLKVQDFCHVRGSSSSQLLDQVLEKGRLLLSCSESRYDIGTSAGESLNEYDRETNMLAKLDASVSSSATDKSQISSMQEFMKERVSLQRSILAKRLGLGGILSSSIVQSSLDDMVNDEDLLELPPPTTSSSFNAQSANRDSQDRDISARERNMDRLKKRRRIEKPGKNEKKDNGNASDDDDDGDDKNPTIRRLLLLSIDHDQSLQERNSNSTRLLSHKTPQTLLATDLIYNTFHPSWHIRHGSLLGLLALLKSWRVSSQQQQQQRQQRERNDNSASQSNLFFGKWPQDILARCLCVLALDRFGDYAGPSIGSTHESNSASLDDIDGVQERLNGAAIVAPVRETAAQVISLLIEMAPVEVQDPCFQVLQKLALYELHWEVRHGAMLSFKYVSALRNSSSRGLQSSSDIEGLGDRVWNIVPHLVVKGLQDDNDDVRGACAQTVSCLVIYDSVADNIDRLERARECASKCIGPLWMALRTVQVTSSCCLDLLQCLCDLVRYDCNLVLATIGSSSLSSSPMEELLVKIGGFMEFDSVSMRLSCLRTLSLVAPPLARTVLDNVLVDDDGVLQDAPTRSLSIGGIVKAYCQLIRSLFESFFNDAYLMNEEDEQERAEKDIPSNTTAAILRSERMNAWTALLDSIHEVVARAGVDHTLIDCPIRETVIALLLRYFNIGAHQSSRSWTYKIISKVPTQYSCQLSAAKAFIRLCTSTIVEVRGIDMYLSVAINSLLRSPWPELCELACILVQNIAAERDEKYHNVIEGSQTSLWNLIDSIPTCLAVDTVPNIDSIRSCDSVKNLCEKALVTVLRKIDVGHAFEDQGSVSSILHIWSDVYKKYGIDLSNTNAGNRNNISLASMRLSASIGGAIVSLGQGQLPPKLTPIIRAMVTMIKNEESSYRSSVCSDFLAQLIRLLQHSPDEKHVKVSNKVLTNICTMASVPKHSEEVPRGCTRRGSKQAKSILQLIVAQMPEEQTLQEIDPIWFRIMPLASSDPAKCDGGDLTESVVMLSSISSALRKRSNALLHASSTLLPTVTLLACASPSALIRHEAVDAVKHFCEVDADLSMPIVLPSILNHLQSIDDDPRRLGSCILLSTIVRSLTVSLCPYVRYLIPIAMSTMTDPLKQCADLSASTFSRLVRVAPLVQLEEDGKGMIPELDVGQWGKECSKKVIDHLIHGKPLPPCQIPKNIETALNNNGITLREYQIEGISWMKFLNSVRLNGALCDDMGLVRFILNYLITAPAYLWKAYR